MEPLRPTLFNIPHWAELLLYISNAIGIAILIGRLYLRGRTWLKGQGKLSFDHFWQRVGRVIQYGLVQVRINRESYAGVMHYSLFLAFVFLFIGTALATVDWDITRLLFNVRILKGGFYLVYELVLDFFTLAGIVGLSLALGRRIFARPAKLTRNFRFSTMLFYFLILFITGLLIESLRLTAMQPPEMQETWKQWSFAGYALSRALLALDLPNQLILDTHLILWIVHAMMVAVLWVIFLDLPTKHIIYSPINVFFSSFRRRGELAFLDLEDQERESFGVGQIHELTPFQLLNGDACTECGRCQAVCPAYMAGTPLNPKQIVLDVCRGLDRYGGAMLRGAEDEMMLVHEITSPDALWACITCYACVHECPVLIEHVDMIVDQRRYLVLMESKLPDLLVTAMNQAERAGNPWGNPKGTRMDWAAGLSVPILAEKKRANVLYWLGCAGAYDPEGQKTARAMVKIFEAAGIDYAVLGEEERCNCEWARRAGNEYIYQGAAHSNIAALDQYEFNLIVTHCPHCYNTFKNEYPQFGGHYEVMHHSVYIDQLIQDGHLKLGQPLDRSITYHDSCYLGRYNDIYAAPRNLIGAADNHKLIEMGRSRGKGLCCGGGGAQVWFETHQEKPVSELRLEEAMDTGAELIGVACPFCTIMLTSAAQSKGVTDQVEIKDVAVIVAEALG